MTDLPPLTKADLEEAVEKGVQKAFRDVGLFVENTEGVEEARSDFRFVRRMRLAFDGAASKIGGLVLVALFGGLVAVIMKGMGGK